MNKFKASPSNPQEYLIDSNAVFDLAWQSVRYSRKSLYSCGELGVASVDVKDRSSKIIFSRFDEGKTCRGLVALPSSDDNPGIQGRIFALFEDRLYYIEGRQVYRVASPAFNATWGQKPYIDQEGQLWVPTQQALLRFGSYQAVRTAALNGSFVNPQENLALANSKALHQLALKKSEGDSESIWLTNPQHKLLKLSKSQGQFLLPKSIQSSGSGPILKTAQDHSSSRLWWVESCKNLYTTRYDWMSRVNQLKPNPSDLQSIHNLVLPKRTDGECVDALAGLDEPNSPLIIARRNEILALDVKETNQAEINDLTNERLLELESGELSEISAQRLKVTLKNLWSRPCKSLECRISALHIHNLNPLVVFAGTESGQLFKLVEKAEPQFISVQSAIQHSAIKVIKESRHGLILGHAQGISLLKLDQDFNVLDEVDLSRFAHVNLPRAPIRDIYKDQEHQIWWIASYGDGLAWLDLSDMNWPKAGRFDHLFKGAQRFLSGLLSIQDKQGKQALWIQSNQGLIRLSTSKLYEWMKLGSKQAQAFDKDALNTVALDEANGWLRPSFVQVGPLVVAATTQQTEFVDTRQLRSQKQILPPHFVSATWHGQEFTQVQKLSFEKEHQEQGGELNQSKSKSKKLPSLIAPKGTHALELALAHPLGVNQPTQDLLYRIRAWSDQEESVWNRLGPSNKLSFAHMKPGEYKVELKSQISTQESQELRQMSFIIPELDHNAEQQWFWSLIFFSLGSGLLVSSLFYRENRSLKIEAKTYELESEKNKSFLNHYKLVFERSDHALLLFSEHGACLEWNPKALELFGLTHQEMYYVLPKELGLSLPSLNEDFSQYRDLPLLCKRPFGQAFPARVSISLHAQKNHQRSNTHSILVSIIDLSTLVHSQDQQLKEQAQQSQLKRLESLGRLAGWVAHEMNNTFGEVEGIIESVEEDLNHLDQSNERWLLLKQASRRGHQHIQQLLNITHRLPFDTVKSTPILDQPNTYFQQELAYCSVAQIFEEGFKHFSWLLTQEQSVSFEYLTEPMEDDDLLGRAFDHDDHHELGNEPNQLSSIDPQAYLIQKSVYDHFTFRLVLLVSEKIVSHAQLKIQQGISFGKALIFRINIAYEDYLNSEEHPWEKQKDILDEQLEQLSSQLETVGAYLTQEFTPKYSSLSLRFPLMQQELDEKLEHEQGHELDHELEQMTQDLQELIGALDDLHELETIDAYPTLDLDVEMLDLDNDQDQVKADSQSMLADSQSMLADSLIDSKQSTTQPPIKFNSGLGQVKAKVLVVDDNEALLKILSQRLSRKDFDIYAFSESTKAQAFILAGNQVDALVTDVLMPHINGRQLAELFHRVCPNLPIIFISAYTDDVLSPNGEFSLQQHEHFMRKPFSPKALITQLNEILQVAKPDESAPVSEPLG